MLASSREANGPIWRKSRPTVTEVLADLIVLAPPDERTALMAVLPANLGGIVLEKSQEPHTMRRSSRRWRPQE
jgi:hypothetical protein